MRILFSGNPAYGHLLPLLSLESQRDQDGAALIDCHHLLHGLARTGRGVAAAVLADAGLDLSAL